MQNKGKNGEALKLQSYKVDNQVLASKINELNDLKSELQNTLNKHRNQQSSIIDELGQIRAQNEKLRALVSDLQFTKKSQAYLIHQLQNKLQISEANVSNLKQRFQKEEKDKISLINHYQKKISMLEQQVRLGNKVPNYEVSRVTQYQPPVEPPFKIQNQSISSIEASSKYDSNKKIKKLKKPSIQGEPIHRPSLQVADKYKSANIIVEKEDDVNESGEDVYLQMIRLLYKQLLKIELKARDLIKIPQIQAFNNLRNPTKNDLAKLFGSYPFHIREHHKIDLIFQFVSRESERTGKTLNGRFIISHVIKGIEQIDGSQGTRQEGDIFSSVTDCKVNNSKFQSQKISRTSFGQQKMGYCNKMSIESALDMQSDTSSTY